LQDDPLDVLDSQLEKRGLRLVDAWAGFIGRNATWDYADQETYLYFLEAYAWASSGEEVQYGDYGDGQTTLSRAPGELPQGKGSNLLYLKYPAEGDVVVEFEGDSAGSDGSTVDWRVSLVLEDGAEVSYQSLDLVDRHALVTLEDGHNYNAIYLVIGAWSEDNSPGETFDYQWRMGVEGTGASGDTADTGLDPKDKRCGCSAGVGLAWSAVLPWWALALVRRRQLPTSSTTTPSPSSNS
jgi:hypothetical protein